MFVGRWPDAGGRGGGGGHRISRRSMWMTTPCCSAVAFTGGDSVGSHGTAAGSGQRIRILAVLRSRYLSTDGRTVNYPLGEPLQRQILACLLQISYHHVSKQKFDEHCKIISKAYNLNKSLMAKLRPVSKKISAVPITSNIWTHA